MGTQKMGRPTKDPKTNVIKIRLSDTDLKKLDDIRTCTGQTMSDIIRKGIELQYGNIKSEK